MEKIRFKKQLREHCISILEKRMDAARLAMEQSQEAANSEGKSSAGDKYETSRAMGQLDRDMNARQLEEAKRDLAYIHSLPLEILATDAIPGAVIVCTGMTFFISLGLGSTSLGNQQVVLLSASAPVARLLEGKKAGDTFFFNGSSRKIVDIY